MYWWTKIAPVGCCSENFCTQEAEQKDSEFKASLGYKTLPQEKKNEWMNKYKYQIDKTASDSKQLKV